MDDDALVDTVVEAWRRLPVTPVVWVAWSGGADSTALLLLALECRARGLLNDVRAVHVDHGLNPNSHQWADHCSAMAQRLAVPLTIRRIAIGDGRVDGLEAAARRARYHALRALITAGEGMATAHHQDDQAETLILRLMRGAGVRGLASMQGARAFAGGWLLRPLLGVPGGVLKPWLKRRGVSWVDDPMNQDSSLDRIYVRERVMPVLQARWPAATRLLARAANHQAQASTALDRVYGDGEITAASLAAMAPRDQVQALRAWLHAQQISSPSANRLAEVVRQMVTAKSDSNPAVQFGRHCLRRYRGKLYIECVSPPIPPGTRYPWQGESRLVLPTGVVLTERVMGEGLDEAIVRDADAELRFRQGGERCRLSGAATTRSLKSLLQQWEIPPWERSWLPLVYVDGQLAAVPGHAVFHGFGVGTDGMGLRLHWQRHQWAEEDGG